MKMIYNTCRLLAAAWRPGRRYLKVGDAGFVVAWLLILGPLAVTAGAADEAKAAGKTPAVAPAARTNQVPIDKSSYLIRSGDMLEVRVYQEEDLNTKTRVDEEGTLVLPLIGRVPVRGLTTESARKAIADRYEADYLNHPQVTVLVAEFAPRRFVMMGQVMRPGVYEIPSSERLNLLQAIAMAGGYTKIADPTKVRIRRASEKGEEILRFNAKALATGGGDVPLIASEDNITVGESAF
jgi:polysaccharide export outer membrane protein